MGEMTVATRTHGSALVRNNVSVTGAATGRPIVFLHGLGCDQTVWRRLTPFFVDRHPVVVLDHVGAGNSDSAAYDRTRYDSLHGYADDVVEVCEELDLHDAVLVGHSVSAMIAVLAASSGRGRIGALVLVGPSPRYLDDPDGDYRGGFAREDLDGLLDGMSTNYTAWAAAMTPVIMGNPDRPELAHELEASFCRTDPDLATHFAEVTFLSDHRADLTAVDVPTLVQQCSDDPLAPVAVGEFVHREIRGSELVVLEATGHCPHVSAPAETAATITGFLARR